MFRGHAQPRGHGQPLPQRSRGGIEEADALHRAGVTVQARIRFPQREHVVHRQRTCLVTFSDHRPQIRQRRVDNGHRVPLGQNQTVRSGVPRMLRQPAHGVIQEDRHEMPQAQCTGGVPTARSGAHVQAGVIELDGFGVDGSFKRHRLPFLMGVRPRPALGRLRPAEPRSISWTARRSKPGALNRSWIACRDWPRKSPLSLVEPRPRRCRSLSSRVRGRACYTLGL